MSRAAGLLTIRPCRSGARSQRSEVRGQRSEVRGQRTGDRGQGTGDRGQGTEVRGQRSEGRGQRAEGRGQRAEGGSAYNALRRDKWRMAAAPREFGGDGLLLVEPTARREHRPPRVCQAERLTYGEWRRRCVSRRGRVGNLEFMRRDFGKTPGAGTAISRII
jgi:hypothetical protein